LEAKNLSLKGLKKDGEEMRFKLRFCLSLLILALIPLQQSCQGPKADEPIPLVTVEELATNVSKYGKGFVDAKGEIIADLSARICDYSGCIPVVLPKQEVDLTKDSKYLEYQRLCLESNSPLKGFPMLVGTLRGKYKRGSFVLHKVINIEARRLKPPPIPETALGTKSICKVHGEMLRQDKVKIIYGLVEFQKGYSEAEKKYFPNSRSDILGGCVLGTEEWATVWYCPKCRSAENEWQKKHHPQNPPRH
jgi:hypothetical protein